ncbi:nuclear transport factor 2 family protein [Sphingopyxis sp.]|uniref:nuclear transport factor 2 family protein n=1 Tax=Sphingopyxis sp. TaxID=1908224 RepID=UPI002613C505|nr:nuclear transport factor 2 family protein [Sphingopyxis sp.]MCW0199429.1 nuclear transport factor 2 family protein [Sphingopyxis sp.]
MPAHDTADAIGQTYVGLPTADIVTAEFFRDFGSRWEAAWNSHDTDEVMALIHPDIRWNDTIFWPEIIHGHDAMRAYVDKIWAVMPDVHFREVQFFSAPDAGRALYLFEQTATAPPASGKGTKATTYGCDIFLGFRDGRLSDYMAQYEITEMMRQFDMLPARNGHIGGAYLLSLMGKAKPASA